MTRCLAFTCALLFASVTIPNAGFASPVDGDGIIVRHLLVRYGDLDLSTVTGIKALDRRIEHALNLVCVGYSGPSAAGTIDPDCKTNGRRAVLPQEAAAIARQKSAKRGTETSISGEKSDALHPSNL